MSQKESGVGKPFQAALLEIEDTFYRTFPAAAQSHGWQTGELSDEECTDQQQVSFVYPQSDGYSRMTANLEPLDSNAPDEESSTIFAHPSAFLASPTSPLAPPEGNAHSAVHSYPLTMVRPRRPSPTLHSPIQQYFQSGGMHSAEIAVVSLFTVTLPALPAYSRALLIRSLCVACPSPPPVISCRVHAARAAICIALSRERDEWVIIGRMPSSDNLQRRPEPILFPIRNFEPLR